MFVSVGVRSARGPHVATNLWHSMFLFVVVSALVVVIAGYVLIQGYEFNSEALSAQLYRGSRRCFYSGKGDGSTGGDGSNGASSTQFSYKTAVAYQPKDRDDPIYKRMKTQLQSATGEDNYFVTLNTPGDVYAGVADGVGGWAEHGYDSSAISRELCRAMNGFSSLSYKKDSQAFPPKKLIEMGYNKIKNDGIVKVGGTTAIAAHFPANGTMQVANLGDSWCGVFRDSKLVFQTRFQTVGFNAPYQLAIIPDEMVREAKKKGGAFIQNKPSDADEYSFQLAKDDLVVLATDGVTDNISSDDIQLFFRDNEAMIEKDLQSVSQQFVSKVVELSKDPNYPSVFAQEVTKLTGKDYRGGKEDDITVVVVKVE